MRIGTGARAALLVSVALSLTSVACRDDAGGGALAGFGGRGGSGGAASGGAGPGGGGPGGGAGGAPATRIVFVAGGPSHGPGEHEYRAGALLLQKLLGALQGISLVTVVHDGGWPTDASVFDGADAVVLLVDGNTGHPLNDDANAAMLAPALARGAGFVCIHWAVHFDEAHRDAALASLGASYGLYYSENPIWLANFTALPAHPITRGVDPFQLQDEWYFNLRFNPEESRLVRLLAAVPDDALRTSEASIARAGMAETLAWAFERPDGGRSFGYTGLHFHSNWGDAHVRRLVVNGILWTARVEVPAGGAAVPLDPADLLINLDPK